MEFEKIFNELYELVQKSRTFTLKIKMNVDLKNVKTKFIKNLNGDNLINIATSSVSIEAYVELSKQLNLFSLNVHSELTEPQIKEKKTNQKRSKRHIE